ncbi:iron permease [Mycena floridula]|nr:iron permease [Mycena floridula]
MNGAEPGPRSTVNMEASKSVPVDRRKTGKGSAFWFSIIALIISTFISALDLSSVGIALPTITENLKGGSNFVWIGSAYALSSTAFIPLSGKLADIFGRKPIMLGSIVLFALGSALAGAAQNMNMLIAARTIQGIGAGSIENMVEIITSDLVPLAERGLYQGIIGLTWAFSSAIGPPIGGVIAEKAWRWLFFMNIPVCVLAFGLVARFLNVRHPAGSLKEKIIRVDWIGNAIVIAGTTLTNIGLAWGGITYPWSSVNVLVPLVLGIILLVVFLLYEFKIPREPTMPYDIFNRTTVSAFFATALHGITSISFIYYLPIYFQACFGNSPIRSSVNMLPTALVIAPFAIVCGVMVQVLNRYLPANLLGWTTTVLGFGLFILLKVNSSVASWVGFQVIISIGIGVLWSSTIFPILAPLPVERTAAALGFFAFSRSFAQSFGITISSTILQNELTKNLPSDFVSRFPDGAQIAYAAIPLIKDLPEPMRSQVRVAFATSMAMIWKVMIGFAGAGLISAVFLEEIPMMSHTDENFGLVEGGKADEKVEVAEKVPDHSSV